MTLPRPLVWVNCAASADGRLAFDRGARARLSGPEDLARVQRLRAESDGIVIGVGTAIADDPSLRVHWELLDGAPGSPPARIVLDSAGRLPATSRLLDGSLPTIIATSERCARQYPAHVTTIVAGAERVDLERLYPELHARGHRRLLVEGGARVLASALKPGLFDRFTIYIAPLIIGEHEAPPVVSGPAARRMEDVLPLDLLAVDRLGAGYVASYGPPRAAPPLPP
ncbi:MAG TPA: dihydrofolate reductase family protein [Thermoplasmata archaeon]|nr:dihydrofolate reductase family protein [Thermoplasmata archaeon]